MSDPTTLNGGSCIAMAGDRCVAIASDLRLGNQSVTVSNDVTKVFEITPRTYVGLPGLYTDTLTVFEHLRKRANLYKMKEGRTISPRAFMSVLSSMLYERRFGPYFISPVVAGLNENSEPFIAGTDLVGCINFAKDFVVAGSAETNLFGMAEALWEPNLGPEELFETLSQTFINGLDRDSLSGGGVVVHIIETDKVTTRYLKTRVD